MATPVIQIAQEIVKRLQTAGHEAYWVGGCVRDRLLGQEPSDYDVATSARPETIEHIFSRTIPVGRQFGILVVLQDGHSIQVATFRSEGEYRDGRHPAQVSFADARTDASRRDFTVNGLFYDPLNDRLFDWVGGQADLKAHLIRTIGSPTARFQEDRLRLLRAVRFAAQLNFQLEPATDAAIRELAPQITSVSAERIRDELIRLFQPSCAVRGLQGLADSGLLGQVLPELEATRRCEQSPDYHPEGTVFNHIRKMLGFLPPESPPSLAWAVLLHDIAKPATQTRDPETGRFHFYGHEKEGAAMAEAILQRLRFPKKEVQEVQECVRHHMQLRDAPHMRRSTLTRLLLRPTFPLELELHRLDSLGSHGSLEVYDFLRRESERLSAAPPPAPLLNGHDLIALGLRPGPEVGRMLSELRECQLQEEITTPAQARDWARRHLRPE